MVMKIVLALFFTLFLAAGVSAQQKKATTKKSTAKKTATTKFSDNTFIANTISSDLVEIELGDYAEKYAADPRVKTFGSTMIRDHRRTKTELKSIATDKNMTVKDAMSAKDKARADALEKKKGAAFDKAYIDMMVNDHTKDVSELRKAGALVKDNHLKELVRKAAILNQTHLAAAKELQASIKK